MPWSAVFLLLNLAFLQSSLCSVRLRLVRFIHLAIRFGRCYLQLYIWRNLLQTDAEINFTLQVLPEAAVYGGDKVEGV